VLTRRGLLGKSHANARGRQPVAALPLEGEPAQPCPLCGDTGRNVTPTGEETACQCLRGKPTVDRNEAPFYRFLREGG
jgi:hypothetical protein